MKSKLPLLLATAALAAACSSSKQPQQSAGAVSAAGDVSAPAAAAAAATSRFGRAPDRGDLVAYPSKRVVRADGAYTWHRADISEAHARRAIASGVLNLTSPSGQPLSFRYERHVEHPSGDWSWIGSVAGDAAQEAIITFGEKAAFGNIAQPGKAPLRLTIRDGVAWLVETDPTKIALIPNAGRRANGPDYLIAPDILPGNRRGRAPTGAASSSMSGSTATASGMTASSTTASATTVDLVLGYTPGFVSYYGGESQALTRLNSLVALTNEAYVNSRIDAQLRLVRTVLVNYTDSNNNKTALEELTGFQAPSTRTTPAAAFAELRAARDTYGADLVSLVRRFNTPENDGCGIAWLIGGGRRTITASQEYFGYSVVSDGRDQDTDGKTYFCRDETLAHELGHNMGSAHDLDTANGDDNVLQSNEYGAFDYSFGYKTASTAGNFYDIMAYGDRGQTSYRVFSNPRVTMCGGLACGVENEADNARSISQTITTIAGFRATVVPTNPVTPPVTRRPGDANADGRSDVLWHGVQAQGFQPWFMNGGSWAYGPVSFIPSAYRVGATGDFNGDGRADMLWHDTARTTLWAWIATGDGTYSVEYLRPYPTGWEPVAAADANGDGTSDIYWHSPAAQGMQVWLMNGVQFTYGPLHAISSQYRMASVGDFNADGRADVLWRDTGDSQLWQWQAQAAGGYSVIFMRDYPRGWQIVGTGDINGDARADVLWHNVAAQATQSWLMQGAAWAYGPVNGIPSQYSPATTGDFNGDGRLDVLWTDATSVWTWLGNGDGSFGVAYLRDYPTGWYVINQSRVNYGGISYGGN